MKSRIIAIPVSKEAKKRLDYDICMDNDLIEYHLNQSEFDELFNMGFFQELNNSLGVMIADYEWEEIPEDKLDRLKKFMEVYILKNQDNMVLRIINDFFQLAYKKNTGVFFFF